ncbi:hypothetical protein GCM10009839_46460 [Catenulispora yoronensis]|uniref:Uncharacterized protein n=2 Tax=Catenulispora yoronensis TaxID=450799 RepID=A0ABP5G2W7_9ACTN
MAETVLAACDECGAEPGQKCGPMCTAPFGPGGPYEYMSPDDEHPAVTAAIAALHAHGVSARVVSPDGRGYLLEIVTGTDGSHIWIGAPEFLPDMRWPEESGTGWVANHRDAEDDFIDAPYYAWDNPDPEPMAAAVASYIAAL